MQGLFISGRRPKSKKEVKDLVKAGEAAHITVEATSFFGNEYEGPLSLAPDGRIDFVGPNPHTSRKFYGNLFIRDGKVTVK